ncbi:hypothetical protein KW795_03120 [Candidatus Microgenomates bacterium]|nr:hypothetical protein [Candidatus Microgenomates bacterium]
MVLIFAYAPAGLGHLRVISALHNGLSHDIETALLGSHDKNIENIHRITSVHPIAKFIYDWMQTGPLATTFAFYYKNFLRAHTKLLYEQLTTILDQRIKEPKKVVMVAAHFGLAHQLIALKERLEKERNIKIYVFVQVTDDTFHPMWYVEGAEILVVPSELAKQKFMDYAKKYSLPRLRIEVLPYPVNPHFFESLDSGQLQDKQDQLDPQKVNLINVSLPVSGAAAGTTFHEQFIKEIQKISKRYAFWVVSKNVGHTKRFLARLSTLSQVNILASVSERQVIEDYDKLFDKAVFSLEVTKPSEQAFKAFALPTQKAGLVMLFTTPVGEQEKDNLKFLERHMLIPSLETNKLLWDLAENKSKPEENLLQLTSVLRGLRLPPNPKKAADFVCWCLENNILKSMLLANTLPKQSDPNPREITRNGVTQFWSIIAAFMKEK